MNVIFLYLYISLNAIGDWNWDIPEKQKEVPVVRFFLKTTFEFIVRVSEESIGDTNINIVAHTC